MLPKPSDSAAIRSQWRQPKLTDVLRVEPPQDEVSRSCPTVLRMSLDTHGPSLGSRHDLLRVRDVLALLKVSKSTLYSRLNPRSRYHDPSFPRSFKLDRGRTTYWRRHDLEAWLSHIFATRHGAPPEDCYVDPFTVV